MVIRCDRDKIVRRVMAGEFRLAVLPALLCG